MSLTLAEEQDLRESINYLTELERLEIAHLLKLVDIKELKLIDFVREFWVAVEPSTPFVEGWHINAICEHLEAVSSGQIRNLVINMPPRHAKSLLVSVFWQVWEWVKAPHTKWIYARYGQSLSTRDSLKCRRLIQHPKFQKKYGYRFKLTGDQSTKTRFDNNKTGYRIATSVSGIGTGEGGDRLVCFVGDTKIKLEFGELRIKDIVEQQVKGNALSFNRLKNKKEHQPILNWFEREVESVIKISIDESQSITCTDQHPIFCLTRGAYIFAKDLIVGDVLMDRFGRQRWIEKIEEIHGKCSVYNIEVEHNNNYYANDILVHNCDDPHNVLEAESQKVRESVLTWWDETMGSRGNDPKTFTRTIVMQRVHQYDLSGHVLEKGTYEHLCLPAEYENKVYISSIGFVDPRTKEGELLWPARFGVDEIKQLKADLGTYASAGQLQQRPAPREGGIVKSGWFEYYKLSRAENYQILNPIFDFILQSWDTAFEEGKENDYSVCTTWGYNNKGAYLVDRWKDKPDFPTLCRRAKMLANEYKPNKIIVERKASGHSMIQTLKKETQLPIVAVQPKGDKLSRLSAVSGYIESGRVFLPESMPWVGDFVDEICMFPNALHDDQVDSMSYALIELFLKSTIEAHNYRKNYNIMGR